MILIIVTKNQVHLYGKREYKGTLLNCNTIYIPCIRRIRGYYGFMSKPPVTRHPLPAVIKNKHEFNRPVCLEAHHYLLAHLSQ